MRDEPDAGLLPNLFIPGAAKSGTSSLHRYLGQHPDIFMSEVKEPHYWTNDRRFPDFENYLKLFEKGAEQRYRGESSTGYMVFDHFIERVKQYVDDPRFIFVLRNPVDRAWSHYWWLRGTGFERSEFRNALRNDMDERPRQECALPGGNFRFYFQYGLYGKWMHRFYDHFQESRILVITSEQLARDARATVNRCYEFLGLKPAEELRLINANPTVILRNARFHAFAAKSFASDNHLKRWLAAFVPARFKKRFKRRVLQGTFARGRKDESYPAISAADRCWLRDLYRDDFQQLVRRTGYDFPEWGDFHLAPGETSNLPNGVREVDGVVDRK